ncbi:MAG: type II toxin-antitoxin system mRNA interferase toxin, RelE/StbE family [Patescibacteria group bacterium]
MKVVLHRRFKKQYKKLRQAEQRRFKERRDLFLQNPSHPLLENHPLHYEYTGCRSINVGGDLRAIFREVTPNLVLFVRIGTHTELYG